MNTQQKTADEFNTQIEQIDKALERLIGGDFDKKMQQAVDDLRAIAQNGNDENPEEIKPITAQNPIPTVKVSSEDRGQHNEMSEVPQPEPLTPPQRRRVVIKNAQEKPDSFQTAPKSDHSKCYAAIGIPTVLAIFAAVTAVSLEADKTLSQTKNPTPQQRYDAYMGASGKLVDCLEKANPECIFDMYR